MPRNTEIKLRVRSEQRFNEYVENARKHCDSEPNLLTHIDTYFPCLVPGSRLKVREKGLTTELISYTRNNTEDVRESKYHRVLCSNTAELIQALTMSNGPPEVVVTKTRHLVMVGQTRIHLDNVPKLGFFIELEVLLRDDQSHEDGVKIADSILHDILKVTREERERDIERGSYRELMLGAAK